MVIVDLMLNGIGWKGLEGIKKIATATDLNVPTWAKNSLEMSAASFNHH
jgi:hypothetical protein